MLFVFFFHLDAFCTFQEKPRSSGKRSGAGETASDQRRLIQHSSQQQWYQAHFEDCTELQYIGYGIIFIKRAETLNKVVAKLPTVRYSTYMTFVVCVAKES